MDADNLSSSVEQLCQLVAVMLNPDPGIPQQLRIDAYQVRTTVQFIDIMQSGSYRHSP